MAEGCGSVIEKLFQIGSKVIRNPDYPSEESPEKFAQPNRTNSYKFVTDLIGIRVFFLFVLACILLLL